MPKAVRYDEFGGIDVLRVEEVARPVPGDGQVLVGGTAVGGLNVAGTTAWGAVHAVQPKGETVVISAAAGGSARSPSSSRGTRATVIGLASESNHEWLKSHGVIPVVLKP